MGRKVLLLIIKQEVLACTLQQELAFIQFMECTAHLDTSDNMLGCVCVQWVTSNELYHTVLSHLPSHQ